MKTVVISRKTDQNAAKLSLFAGTTIALMILLSACGSNRNSGPAPVLVAAASDLNSVSRPLTRAFEKSTGIPVTFGFGSSAQLEQQIRHGAIFDVYAPAARSYCTAIEHDGLTDGPDRQYAVGRLVAWSKTVKLQSLDGLSDSSIRQVAIGNPKFAPYGVAAQKALEKAGLWKSLQPKIVLAENVSHALQMAETGNAEVALVAAGLVQGVDGSVMYIDQSLYPPIEQVAVVLSASKNKQAARAFVDFLLSPEAQSILKEYGFTKSLREQHAP
jgi:molybdate transport system substrate-binding protein